MTNSKSHQVKILCGLRNIDIDSEEAQVFFTWSVLDLLVAIKKEREDQKKPVVEEDEEENCTFSYRAGCRY